MADAQLKLSRRALLGAACAVPAAAAVFPPLPPGRAEAIRKWDCARAAVEAADAALRAAAHSEDEDF